MTEPVGDKTSRKQDKINLRTADRDTLVTCIKAQVAENKKLKALTKTYQENPKEGYIQDFAKVSQEKKELKEKLSELTQIQHTS